MGRVPMSCSDGGFARHGERHVETRSDGGAAVTARRFPEAPVFASHAEQLFADALQEHLPDDAVLFCGQRFSDRKQDREADLIVAWPGVGVAVIEVKGGSVYLQDGEWRQSGRTIDKVIHPVDQARICKYALRDYLDGHPRWSAGNPRLGHLVALPTTTLPEDFWLSDLPRWMVRDKSDLPFAASRVEAALRKLVDVPEPPTVADVEALVDCPTGAAIPQQDLEQGARPHRRRALSPRREPAGRGSRRSGAQLVEARPPPA